MGKAAWWDHQGVQHLHLESPVPGEAGWLEMEINSRFVMWHLRGSLETGHVNPVYVFQLFRRMKGTLENQSVILARFSLD